MIELLIGLLGVASIAVSVCLVVAHIGLAIAVSNDAARRNAARLRVWFLPPSLWTFVVLPTGIVGAALYWLMHSSRLARGPESPLPPRKPEHDPARLPLDDADASPAARAGAARPQQG